MSDLDAYPSSRPSRRKELREERQEKKFGWEVIWEVEHASQPTREHAAHWKNSDINSKMLLGRYVSEILQIGTFLSDSSFNKFIRNSPEKLSELKTNILFECTFKWICWITQRNAEETTQFRRLELRLDDTVKIDFFIHWTNVASLDKFVGFPQTMVPLGKLFSHVLLKTMYLRRTS